MVRVQTATVAPMRYHLEAVNHRRGVWHSLTPLPLLIAVLGARVIARDEAGKSKVSQSIRIARIGGFSRSPKMAGAASLF